MRGGGRGGGRIRNVHVHVYESVRRGRTMPPRVLHGVNSTAVSVPGLRDVGTKHTGTGTLTTWFLFWDPLLSYSDNVRTVKGDIGLLDIVVSRTLKLNIVCSFVHPLSTLF